MARQRLWKPEELGRQQIRAWTSCRSRWRGARGGENQIQNQFHHRRSGRSRNLGGKSSCPAKRISSGILLFLTYRRSCTHQNPTNLIQSTIQDLLTNGVVTSGVVVGGILLTTDQQLGVEELTVVTSSDLIDWGRVQINEDGTRDVFAAASLGEDSVEFARGVESARVGIWATILQQTVLEEVPGREISANGPISRCGWCYHGINHGENARG